MPCAAGAGLTGDDEIEAGNKGEQLAAGARLGTGVGRNTVTAAAAFLRGERGSPFCLVHGRLPTAERDELMRGCRAGELRGLTGVDDPYEPPAAPELLLPTQSQSVAESIDAVYTLLLTRVVP